MFSEISKSSEDGSEEGTSDTSNRTRRNFRGPNDARASKKGRLWQIKEIYPTLETKMVIQRRWTNFFNNSSETPSYHSKPGSKTMDSVINMRRSSRNEFDIERSRKTLESISRTRSGIQDKDQEASKTSYETNSKSRRRPSLLSRLGLNKKK